MMYRAKKSLGQNFLKSELALNKIIEAGEIKPEDVILEIGPGKGALTKKLLASSCQVLAIEKDKDLYKILKTQFEKEISSGQLNLVNDDILKFEIDKTPSPFGHSPFTGGEDASMIRGVGGLKYKIVANIPYNITGAILKKFLTAENQPERMILMVQHEVAQRIVARGGKESILSISVKAYGEPKMILKVPKRYFSPTPKVDSAVISIKDISRINFHPGASATPQEGNNLEKKFWEIVKAGFAHKRKKLSSNLKSLKYGGNSSVESLGNKRAEDLSLKDWLNLIRVI